MKSFLSSKIGLFPPPRHDRVPAPVMFLKREKRKAGLERKMYGLSGPDVPLKRPTNLW